MDVVRGCEVSTFTSTFFYPPSPVASVYLSGFNNRRWSEMCVFVITGSLMAILKSHLWAVGWSRVGFLMFHQYKATAQAAEGEMKFS